MATNSSSSFSADVSAYKGGRKVKKMKKAPKALKGDLKQTEGYTPRKGMPSKSKAPGGKKGVEKRLSGMRM